MGSITNISVDSNMNSWYFDPKTIRVTAEAGKVRLTGAAHSMHDRQIAGLTAWSARGVTAVENDITVN